MWRDPDEGIWEIRGQRQHFTYSKVSAWTAIDRAVKFAEATGADAPLDRWRAVRDEIHAEVLAKGYDAERNTFVQYYGGKGLDASLLLIPASGFLPADDPRVLGTIDAIQREICDGPFVWRYSTEEGVDGLAGSEGAFLICSFWLVSALAKAGRVEAAERNLEQLMALQNDVGLLSEEYDPQANACWATSRRRSRTSDCCAPSMRSPKRARRQVRERDLDVSSLGAAMRQRTRRSTPPPGGQAARRDGGARRRLASGQRQAPVATRRAAGCEAVRARWAAGRVMRWSRAW